MDDRLQTALKLAKQAGTIIKKNFGKQQRIEFKDDRSPVTAIDKQINAMVVEALRTAHPEDGLLGEEEDYGNGGEEYQWICDPLDGTKPFILGLPNSVFMLGLSTNGAMVLSVVYDPYTDKLYRAVKGQGAFCNDRPIRVSEASLAEGYALISPDSMPYGMALKAKARGIEPVPGTGFKCMMIAEGRGVGMLNDSADFHDIGPGSLIVEEAGGKVTTLDGEALRYNAPIGGVIISNAAAFDELLEIARNTTI